MLFVASHTLSSLFARVYAFSSALQRTCGWLYKHMHVPVQHSQHLSRAETRLRFGVFFSAWCCSTLLFYTLDAISCYLETQLSIISIVAGKPQRALDLLLIFFLLVTLKWIAAQRSRNYRMPCVLVWVCLRQSVKLFVGVWLWRWKLAGEWQKMSSLGAKR